MRTTPITAMAAYFMDEGYISHALRVSGYALALAEGEGLSPRDARVLYIAAVFHDVGIPVGLRQEGSSAGPVQERLGAPVAKDLARPFLQGEDEVETVGFLVAHHHSFAVDGGPLLQLLFEADWLVNASGEAQKPGRAEVYHKYFKSETGRFLFQQVYPGEAE